MDRLSTPNPTGSSKSVRSILLRGVFWRILIIEAVLLVWSVGWRAYSQGGTFLELAAYAGRIVVLIGIIVAFMIITLRGFLNRKVIGPLEAISEANRAFEEGGDEALEMELGPDAPVEMVEIAATRRRMLEIILRVSEERLKLVEFIRETFGRTSRTRRSNRS